MERVTAQPSTGSGRHFDLVVIGTGSGNSIVDESFAADQLTVPGGTSLFEQGDPSDVVYEIDAGEVDIVRVLADGGEETLARLGPGQYFGELGPLMGFPRSASARAVTEVTLTRFSPHEFRERILNRAAAANQLELPKDNGYEVTIRLSDGSTLPRKGKINFADRDWQFEYIESLPLEYNDNTFTTNLTSMLAVYAYLIIGVDYDSFSELGGTPYFQRALQVVNNAQQSNRAGWASLGSNRNRYWIVENYNSPQMVDLRKAFYAYHRLGLDNFDKDPDKSREVILKGLRDIKKVRDVNPQAILIVSFFDAKGKELANIFSAGNIQVRREAYDIIVAIDPSNSSSYEKIIQN